MKKSLCAVVAAVGMMAMSTMSTTAFAGPTAAEQTSQEQVSLCRSNTTGCREGDQNACHIAMKTCVGKARQDVMTILEEG